MTLPWVVAITGASGAAYSRRLVEVLLRLGTSIHLSISQAGAQVWQQELGVTIDLDRMDPGELWPGADADQLRYHRCDNFFAPIASGSYRTAGMVICPCSGGTLAAIAHGMDQNLIQRAANVHLKERRKLILVPRETPLSLPMIENFRTAHQAGATILPASPGWYNSPQSLDDLIDFVVARILDQMGLDHKLGHRWGSTNNPGDT